MHGTKVSRKGYPVETASDKQLAFSSEWPLLPIEAEGTIQVTNNTSYDQVLYTHNLGYPPIFMIWEENGGKLYSGGKELIYNIYVTSTTVHLEDFIIEDCTLHWKIFRRPMLTTYDSGTLVSTDATEKDSGDYGILVSLPGKDVESTDKRDFSIRSDVRQLMVHLSGYTTEIGLTGSVTHSLGYQPMYLLYIEAGRNPSGAYSISTDTGDFAITVTDTTFSWEFFGEDGFKYAYILFKDPLTTVG